MENSVTNIWECNTREFNIEECMDETLIKTQEHLNKLIEHTPMIGNIYYDDKMNYIPIDWEHEYIKMVDIGGKTTLKRIVII